MRRTLPETIVGLLSLSSHSADRTKELRQFSPREWRRALRWLDDAGLALYFLRELKGKDTTEAVPEWVISRLERNFALNQQRLEDMSRRFDLLNHKFNGAGVRYAAIKGFSLVPEFCPDAALRYQADFDYLVDHNSLPAARQVLLDVGYSEKASPSSQESIFVSPGGSPLRNGEQYSAKTPHAVELHVDIWDGDFHRLPPLPRLFSVERAATHHWNGLTFPALSDVDAFLLQVLHACHHLFTQWIRMSCLLEIGCFLNRRAQETALWKAVEQRVGDCVMLREFVVIVTELVSQLFTVPLPAPIQIWGGAIRPRSRVWLDNYARRWAFSELPVYQLSLFPRSKLALFLHQQYMAVATPAKKLERKPAPSLPRLSRMASSLRRNPSLALDREWWRGQHLVRRSIFRALAEARYLYELPRWVWLNRSMARSAST